MSKPKKDYSKKSVDSKAYKESNQFSDFFANTFNSNFSPGNYKGIIIAVFLIILIFGGFIFYFFLGEDKRPPKISFHTSTTINIGVGQDESFFLDTLEDDASCKDNDVAGCEVFIDDSEVDYDTEGSYSLYYYALDANNNRSKTLTRTVDITYSPKVYGVSDGDANGTGFTPTFLDGSTATLNGDPYTSGTPVTNNGPYTLRVTHPYFVNSTVINFYVDKEPPTINSIKKNNNSPLNPGDISDDGVKVSFSDNYSDNSSYPNSGSINAWYERTDEYDNIHNRGYSNGSTMWDSGDYTLYISDEFGNTTSIDFIIDREGPDINTNLKCYGTSTNDHVTVTYDDDNYGPVHRSINEPNITATYEYNNGTPTSFNSGYTFTAAGSYEIISTDYIGNDSHYHFEINHTDPESWGEIDHGGWTEYICNDLDKSIYGSGSYKTNVEHTNDPVTLKFDNVSQNQVGLSATYGYTSSDGNSVPPGNTPVSYNHTFTNEGRYIVDVTDGTNHSYVNFIIDKTKPTGSLSVSNGATVSTNVSITGINDNYTPRSELNTSCQRNYQYHSCSINGSGNMSFSQNGYYEIDIYDDAGNRREFEFTIDKTGGASFNFYYINKRNNELSGIVLYDKLNLSI